MIRNIVFDMGQVMIRFDPAVFMDREALNTRMGEERSRFSGYFSREIVTDIDEEYIASVIRTV